MGHRSVLVNKINGVRHHTSVPITGENLVIFSDAFIEGEYSVYYNGVTRLSNNDLSQCIECVANLSDITGSMKTSIRVLLKSETNEDLFMQSLKGLVINNILVENVNISLFRVMDI